MFERYDALCRKLSCHHSAATKDRWLMSIFKLQERISRSVSSYRSRSVAITECENGFIVSNHDNYDPSGTVFEPTIELAAKRIVDEFRLSDAERLADQESSETPSDLS